MGKPSENQNEKGYHKMTKMELQLRINEEVAETWQYMRHVWNNGKLVCMKRLRHCQAWVYTFEDENGHAYHVLRSYGTMVAGVSPIGDKYDWLRYVFCYTATSAQHIAKFFQDYGDKDCPMFRYYPV